MIDKYFIPKDSNNIIVFDSKTLLPSKREYVNNIDDVIKLENILECLDNDILRLLDINNYYETKYIRNKYINRILKRVSTLIIILIVGLSIFNGIGGVDILSFELKALIFLYGASTIGSIFTNPKMIKKKIRDINSIIDVENNEREDIINRIDDLKKSCDKERVENTLVSVNYMEELEKEKNKIKMKIKRLSGR